MTARNPLVVISGQIKELPSGDTVNGATGGSGGPAPNASNLYIQQTDPAGNTPAATSPYFWVKTDVSGNVIDLLKG